MTLKVKKDGAWKEASSLKVKINGEWKDVSTLYSKKDGVWVTVYSSGGVLIEFLDYPYSIPVASGWEYSTDGSIWTKITAGGEINADGGMFTGFVKANSITLNGYCTEYTPAESGKRMDVEPLSVARRYPTAFVNGGKGYVCGGNGVGGNKSTVDVYDQSGNRTTGSEMSVVREMMTSFTNGNKGYVCGGHGNGYIDAVDVYDSSGNRTTGTSLSVARYALTSFVNNSKGYVCGGSQGSSSCYNTVDVYDSSGNRSTGASLSVGRHQPTSFFNSSKGYVCGGQYYTSGSGYTYCTTVDVYDSSGNRSTGASLSVGRYQPTSFVNGGNGYVCGGFPGTSVVDVYSSSGVRTTGTAMSITRYGHTSFANASKGYVCGGHDGSNPSPVVDIYDTSGNRTAGDEMSAGRYDIESFVNGDSGYVCGGYIKGNYESDIVDRYYDGPEIFVTKIPITEGSVYTLNGVSGTAGVSKIMEFDSRVSGTIRYKEGDLLPAMSITVLDDSGNVIEGATISLEKIERWDFTNAVCYTTYSGSSIIYYIRGVEGSYPAINSVKIRNDNYGRESIVNTSDPNTASVTIHGPGITTVTVSFYSEADGGGDVVASYTFSGPKIVSGTPPS